MTIRLNRNGIFRGKRLADAHATRKKLCFNETGGLRFSFPQKYLGDSPSTIVSKLLDNILVESIFKLEEIEWSKFNQRDNSLFVILNKKENRDK